MRLQRRNLLQALSGLGLFAALPSHRAGANVDRYDGPFLITVHAGGGWEPTTFCDGKLPTDALEVAYDEPATTGAFTHAPLSLKDGAVTLDTVGAFFADYGSRLTVINGIDTQTNNHQTGIKHTWSGKTFEELPSLGALFAGAKLGDKRIPVPFLSSGVYDITANLVPLTRIATPTALRAVSLPGITNPAAPQEDWEHFHAAETEARVRSAAAERLTRVGAGPMLPNEAAGVLDLGAARSAMAGLEDLMLALPATPTETKTAFPELAPYNDATLSAWLRTAETALYAFSSGQAAAANIFTGSFDTHAAHDTNQQKVVGKLFLLLRFIFRLADELGLSDKLTIVVGSEFGRTPRYNAGAGKDHWNVTSMMVSGPGIAGNRVIGATDDELRPMRLDPNAPSTTLPTDDAAGTRLYPAHIQRALRRTLGIEASEPAGRFLLPVEHPLDDILA